MDSIRFTAPSQPLRPEVLNHRTSSPFTQNQIQFHIGSAYLQDFTDKGITDFVKAHQPGGKDLSVAEVKTFIQRVAANAEAAKNISFDLCDPELGLAEDDGISKRHLEGAFTLNVSDRSVLPAGQAGQVRFVDVTSASFDLKEQETTIASLTKELEGAQKQLADLKAKKADTQSERSETLSILPPGSEQRLKLITERKSQIGEQIAQLDLDKEAYTQEKAKPETSAARKRELDFILAGLPGERSKLVKERDQLDKQLNKNDGYLLQHESLNKLDRLNDEISKLNPRIQALETKVQTTRDRIAAVKAGKPDPGPNAPPAKPAEKPAAASAKPDTPATPQAAEAKPGEVKAGLGLDLDELRKQPPNHQATRLASLPADQQKAVIAQLSADERQQIQTATDGYLAKLTGAQSSRVQKQLESYKALGQNLKDAPAAQAPAKPDETPAKPDEAPADRPVAPAQPEQTVKPGEQPAKPTTQPAKPAEPPQEGQAPTNTGDGDGPAAPLAAGAITSDGKQMVVNGKPLTLEGFKALSIDDKFKVLLDCDSDMLRPLLQAAGPERAKIREAAQKYVEDYKATQASLPQGSVEANYAATTVSGPPVNYRNESHYSRAQEIIRIIDELDGRAPSSPQPAETQPQTPAGAQTPSLRGHTLEAGEKIYQVKPGDTAKSIAKSEAGNELFDYDIFDRNPGLEQAMQAAHNGQPFDRYSEDLSKYKEYLQLIVSRTPKNSSPVSRTEPRKPEPVKPNPVVTQEQDKPAQKPADKPVTPPATPPVAEQKPAKPAPKAEPTAPLVEEDPNEPVVQPAVKPATPPAAEQKPEKPVVVEEAPVTPPVAPPAKPAQKPATQPAAEQKPAKPAPKRKTE